MKQPMTLQLQEHSTVVWHVTLPVGQEVKDALAPSYWQHVAHQLRPGHEIMIAAEDRTEWAHLFVRDVGKQEAVVAVITSEKFSDKIEMGDEAQTTVKWRSPQSKYGVFRKTDNECLQDGFETKEAAYTWAAQREALAA